MKVKCQNCEKKDTDRNDMAIVQVKGRKMVKENGKILYNEDGTAVYEEVMNKNYVHKQCEEDFLSLIELRERDKSELDQLNEVLKQIYEIKEVPNQFFPYLQDVRNGSITFGKKIKKYKEGFPYAIITETYLSVRKDIEWAKKNKDFTGLLNELRYGLAIVKDKIFKVNKQVDRAQVNEIRQKNAMTDMIIVEEEPVKKFKNKGSKKDISEFL